jgi:hypothetical protein
MTRTAPESSACRCCGLAEVEVVLEQRAIPVSNSLMFDTEHEARSVPTGDMSLGFCPVCGFLQNSDFDPLLPDYGSGYEDTQAHSPQFVEYATSVSEDLVERHGLFGSRILEIGCGKGDFLRIIASVAQGTGVGYDPAVGPGAFSEDSSGHPPDVILLEEPYTADVDVEAELVVCRHTLEHIADVRGFVSMVAESFRGRRPVLFIEVPDTARILAEGAFWDIYYEHCSYFTAPTLAWLLQQSGMEVLHQRLAYGDQYLLTEARWDPDLTEGPPPTSHASQVGESARRFARMVTEQHEAWTRRILRWSEDGRTVALWGGSSKTVSFLAGTSVQQCISAVVDINPRKHDRFLPGSGLRVSDPAELPSVGADVIVAMNPVYVAEIRRDLEAMGVEAEVMGL